MLFPSHDPNTIGSGYIRLNANPNDPATPFMDVVERTGSGIYDVELKARLGDLSGLANSTYVFGEANPGFGLATDNVYLQGGIKANFGDIGGFSISSDTISSSNDSLILRSNGQITGSEVLIQGGRITDSVTIEGELTVGYSGSQVIVSTGRYISGDAPNTIRS